LKKTNQKRKRGGGQNPVPPLLFRGGGRAFFGVFFDGVFLEDLRFFCFCGFF